MPVKVFAEGTEIELEQAINNWLENKPTGPLPKSSMQYHFSTACCSLLPPAVALGNPWLILYSCLIVY